MMRCHSVFSLRSSSLPVHQVLVASERGLLPKRGSAFREGHKNLRCRLRRVFGRKRKSRRAEAAGRRNSPEAVPNGRGGMRAKERNESNAVFGEREAQSTRGATLALESPAGGLRTRNAVA